VDASIRAPHRSGGHVALMLHARIMLSRRLLCGYAEPAIPS
jgi:hypothetical protein